MDIQQRFIRLISRHDLFMRAYNQEELESLISRIKSLSSEIQNSDFAIIRDLLFPTQVYTCELESSLINLSNQLSIMKDDLNPENLRRGNVFLQFLNNMNPSKGRPFKKAATSWMIHELTIIFTDPQTKEVQWHELTNFLLQKEGTRLRSELAPMIIRHLDISLEAEFKDEKKEVIDEKKKIELIAGRLKKRNETWIENCKAKEINPSYLNDEQGKSLEISIVKSNT